ncbi:D-alanyl-D-alanine carboxypeptidase [Rathayibacter agropyri]
MYSTSTTTASPARRRRTLAAALVLAVVLLVAMIGAGWVAATTQRLDPALAALIPADQPGETDGFIDDAAPISPFDDDLPAIARLRPALRTAMQAAATDAQADDVSFVVTNGWRSERYQQALFDDAVRTYGSEAAASRLVAPVTTSRHVSGDAIDIGHTDADNWLKRHGADYGLCQIYANEIWHFELATTPGGECPTLLPDASWG